MRVEKNCDTCGELKDIIYKNSTCAQCEDKREEEWSDDEPINSTIQENI